MRKKNLKGVDGCVFPLLIIYFHETHFGEESEKAEAQPPWLAYWKDHTLKKKIKVEFEDPGGLVNQARSKVPKRLPSAEKKTTKKVGPPKKAQIMSSTLAKSLQIKEAKGKEILRKRKHIEEVASSESEHESKSKFKSESEFDSDSDLEKTISEDEAVGRIERRTKRRHEAMNAEAIQPPRHAEAELNTAAAIVDPTVNSSSSDRSRTFYLWGQNK
ncbi:hypothetical protein PIB30_106520 [Stylosanthes scabra]|uniref:Uncharacterized protein n=1 Tax=Stylosanthes scabra TaxID=79078 RepID=A0ABU6UYQ6_9FABA|nr:hypothetical protein [Stylosanthes scabra]